VHLGRSIPTTLRTAVETKHRTCMIAGCDVDRHLEIDHNIPYAQGGPTTLENLGPLCHHHHDHKTRRDLRRLGPPGRQRLVSREEYEQATRRSDAT
jgi:5-methylcytosine-specific restriction endonuclease McrA